MLISLRVLPTFEDEQQYEWWVAERADTPSLTCQSADLCASVIGQPTCQSVGMGDTTYIVFNTIPILSRLVSNVLNY